MADRMTKVLIGLGFFSIFILASGLGAFLHYQNYHPLAFFAVYVTLFGLPFLWILPHTDMSKFRMENGILIGAGTVILVGLFHLIHFLADGDRESFLIIFPLATVFEAIAVGSYMVMKERDN